MSYDRISQEDNGKKVGINSLLEAASDEARRILESVQALAGTASCKGVQIAGLKKWAITHGYWMNNHDALGVFSDRGSENEVYMDIANGRLLQLC